MNSFGHFFRMTTWGESHGPAIGCVVDGCPPGIALAEHDIQPFLDARRPGQSRFTTQRREADTIRILSGVYDSRTTGTPISLLIENHDQRPKDYAAIGDRYRPGHADYSYDAKYGLRDPRGGGRASARETACRVAAGAIARKVLPDVAIHAFISELGGDAAEYGDGESFDAQSLAAALADNALFAPDPGAARRWEARLDAARRAGDSLGAIVTCIARGVPAGWGAPVYGKLDAALAGAMMSIPAVKGVELGDGFAAARLTGAANADAMRAGADGEGPAFLSNHAGGILGGISTGQPIVCRVAFKPTSSIRIPVASLTRDGAQVDVATQGRHDPCVAIRGVPVVAAMMALCLADARLQQRAQCG